MQCRKGVTYTVGGDKSQMNSRKQRKKGVSQTVVREKAKAIPRETDTRP